MPEQAEGVEATLDAERLNDHARTAVHCISTTVTLCLGSNVTASVMQQALSPFGERFEATLASYIGALRRTSNRL